jgi:hypothetical protein
LAYKIGIEKGLNVDRPRNLAKSVTVEWVRVCKFTCKTERTKTESSAYTSSKAREMY